MLYSYTFLVKKRELIIDLQFKINKNKHKSLTFRKRKHINLRTKTLRGGVKFDLTNIISQNSNPKKMAIKKNKFSEIAEHVDSLAQYGKKNNTKFAVFPEARARKENIKSQIEFITKRNQNFKGIKANLLTNAKLNEPDSTYNGSWKRILTNCFTLFMFLIDLCFK